MMECGFVLERQRQARSIQCERACRAWSELQMPAQLGQLLLGDLIAQEDIDIHW